ncbi:MAG: Crp/Fnr family transcriptional regulator [Gammaproteobacteria bacterium]|nr:Crp/Fnr family transcriptional regulator [Gammaproteobacteria bacterium]
MDTRSAEDKQSLIARSYLFNQVPEWQLKGLAQYAKVKSYKKREVVFRRGDLGTQMYFIVRGSVSLTTDSDEGKELTFGLLGPGDIFGEIAMLDGGERTATVKTIESSELLVIEKRDFVPFLEKNPKVAISLLSTIASRVRKADELCEDNFFKNLPNRLAKRFLGLADNYGRETETGVEIGMKLSQGDIGKLAGASRESINKQLKAWEEDGLISVENGYITIREVERMEDLCDA